MASDVDWRHALTAFNNDAEMLLLDDDLLDGNNALGKDFQMSTSSDDDTDRLFHRLLDNLQAEPFRDEAGEAPFSSALIEAVEIW